MRNLKKILALVLALVMVVGMMTVASAATPGTSFKDDASIDKFDEAVQVLEGLGIYEGDENAAFNPNNTITRAEVATLVYRVLTGDVNGTYVHIYSDYNQFADVDSNAWYAGYVNFCANAGMLMGDGTNFYPMEKVTGYQVLAIMLRVIGYGREGEYEGANWHIRTASKAAELDITKNIVAGTLGAYSTRAMVAEMIYRSIAQTETVVYDRIWMYHGTDETYAYDKFGLEGDVSMIERSPAEKDGKYDEPVAYWKANVPGGKIYIRFNPVAKYTDYVADETIYAAVGGTGAYVTSYQWNIDGALQGSMGQVNLYKDPKNTTIDAFGGKGVETIVFALGTEYDEGRIFIVEKNTYVDFLTVAKVAGQVVETLTWTDSDKAVKTGLAHGTGVIFNMYMNDAKGSVMQAEAASVHAAPVQVAVVTNTYDTNAADSSYFIANGVKYGYNSAYATRVPGTGALGNRLPQVILNRDEVSMDVQTNWAGGVYTDKFDANQVVYFDDFNNVILTHDVPTTYTANEKGYVFVRSAAYGGQIADNRWVSSYTVITADGQAATIKGATNANGWWDNQYAASDADYELGLYAYEIVNGYYALYKVDTGAESHIVDNTVDYALNMTQIICGDADAIVNGANAVVDDNTMFIIANYDKTGMITGYSVIKGFKNIPDLKGALKVEYVRADYSAFAGTIYEDYIGTETIELVLVLGAKQENPDDTLGAKDTYFYLADTTPEDFVVTYDTHKVIANGQAGTMKFVPNLVLDNNLTNGFYKVTKTQAKTGYVSQVEKQNTVANCYWRAAGVVAAAGDYVTLSANCAIYEISATGVETISEADLIDLGTFQMFVAAKDDYGFASVVYVID